jgi:N-methylhydantoinase B/oxoprolinase/acetone carboxylase alpha subunit
LALRKIVMQPDDEVTLETPGGGGYGQPINSQ